ncbi:hypothetical protein EDB86DRAFT_2795135 [Lactarius hatsudake]|nr:hypothetical protein EDB86DRAFT_2795135 [Lactarius hatsudake]
MVNIYLNVDRSTFLFLSILDSDVRRLSIYPFKWLRFVMFSVCGARGCLSTTPDGPPINYDSASLNGITDLYYTPLGNCIFVDYQGLSDRAATSSVPTDCPNNFRDKIIARDGLACIVTRYPVEHWIDDVRNGVLLTKSVHSMLAHGETPNYGLDTADIPRIDLGQARTDHFTLQHLKVPEDYDPAPGGTTEQGTVNSLPPAIICDYMYGVAAYKQWGRQGSNDVHVVNTPVLDKPLPASRRHYTSTRRGDTMAKAVDDLNFVLMRLSGTTLEEVAKRGEKRMEEERAAQETGRGKVMEWMELMNVSA